MRFAVLGSGSKGNALVVDGGGVRVLIDCGFSPKALRARLRALDLTLADIDAVLITHGHSDHIRGASALAGGMRKLVYATFGTHKMIARSGGITNWAEIEPNVPFEVGGLCFRPFPTPHDAPGSVGFTVDDGDARLGLCTDLGDPAAHVAEALSEVDSLYLEFNHDLEMLRHGPYPDRLKRRIAGPYGHLSNAEAARLLAASLGTSLRRLVLAHLSEVNNTPQLALDAARAVVDGRDISVGVAPQHHPTGWLKVGQGPKAVATPAASVPSASTRARDASTMRAAPASDVATAAHASVAVRRQLSLFRGRD